MTAAIPTAVMQFLADASWSIRSAAAAPGCLEHEALRASWLQALAAVGMTETQARSQSQGLYRRAIGPRLPPSAIGE